jgi:hypothetical protein
MIKKRSSKLLTLPAMMEARDASFFLSRVETPKPRCPGAPARSPAGKRHMFDSVAVPSINVNLCFNPMPVFDGSGACINKSFLRRDHEKVSGFRKKSYFPGQNMK